LYNAIIIDDEQNAIDVLQLLLKEHCPEVTVIGQTISSVEGIRLIENLTPDIVFLDIEMPRLNGFQMLEKVSDIHFHLIFTTGYEQYAVKAFKSSALDYLLKPIMAQELKNAVKKLQQLDKRYYDKVRVLEQNMQAIKNNHPPERIILPHTKGYLFQKVNEILYCEALNTYTKFYIEGKPPLMITKPLGEIEEILISAFFFRTHRHYLVNLKKIIEFMRNDGGFIIMSNGDQLPVSRNKRQMFIQVMNGI
jgi:two-component system, LytTR family, response regulator